MALLAAGLLASCSKDADLTDFNQSKPLEEDQSFFVNINVMGVDALTRADEDPTKFFTGTAEENRVNSIYFVFYDKDGTRVSTTQVRKDNATSGNYANNGAGEASDSNKYEGEKGDAVEGRNSFYQGVVQIDVKHGSLPPAYVMAFINPITSQNFDINPDFATLKAVSQTTRPKIMGDNGNFAMSKSVYFGLDRVQGEGHEHDKIVATPLLTADKEIDEVKYLKQLFTTKSEAEAALESGENSRVDIYVERYAARVDFKIEKPISELKIVLNEDDKEPGKAKQGLELIKLDFKPEYWAVNAYESNTYIVKSFLGASKSEDGEVDYNVDLTWEGLNEALGSDVPTQMPWFWNSEKYHRCYWAQTPAYYAQSYPRTADDIYDNGEDHYALGYYSYNNMVDNANKNLNAKARNLQDDTDKTKPIYARENTVAGSALIAAYNSDEDSPKAAIPSVVLVGHYEIEEDGKPLGENEFIYIQGNATNGYTLYKYDDMLRYFVNTTIPFATREDNDYLPIFEYNKQYEPDEDGEVKGEIGDFTAEGADFKDFFTIIHPKQEGEDVKKQVIDSRFVTIQLDKTKFTSAEDIDLYASIGGVYQKVTSANIDKINEQMFYAAGTVQGYNGGKVYYSIPIQHLGFQRNGNPNAGKTANNKEFNWEEVKSGDFGLVRNHVYTIIVEDIKGLGNGIPNPDDPIVPPTDPEEYYIGARLIVLNWAMVDEQRETL